MREIIQKPNYMVCPAYGRESDFLTLCNSCEWEDLEENQKHRKFLNAIRPYAGNNAYLGHGCMVRPDCENDFYWKSEYCQVQVFYRHGINRLLSLQLTVDGLENPLRRLIYYWTQHSRDQDVLEYRVEIFKRVIKDREGSC